MTAKLIDNLPAHEYHADPCPTPSLSSGIARVLINRSPLAAWRCHPKLNTEYVENRDPKFLIGTAAHAVLLEEDASRIVIVKADDWKTKAAREERDAALAERKTPLLEHEYEQVRDMATAARAFIAQTEFADDWKEAKSEQTIVWEEDGIWCRVRVDRLPNKPRVMFDYKTTGDASPEAFKQHIPSMGYAFQDAFYRRAVRALGHPDPTFLFLAQETEAPYDCALYACDPELQAISDRMVQEAIDLWRKCLQTATWQGYGTSVHWASAPAWLVRQVEGMLVHG